MSATILVAFIKIISQRNIVSNVNILAIVVTTGFAFMGNAMKDAQVPSGAVQKRRYVALKNLRLFGERADGGLHMGNVLNV